MSLIDEIIGHVRDTDVRLVLLRGDAGVGKSFLLDRVAERLDADRAWGLRALSEVPLASLAHLVPPSPTRIELIRTLLTTAGAVLCVDDLIECDALSQSLIHRLTLDSQRTVIATVRTERGRIQPDIETLLARPSTRAITVPPLSRADTDRLVRDLLGGEPEAALLDAVWQRSEGNPLFASQVIGSARANGTIELRDDRWVSLARLPVPATLRETLLDRLDALDEPAREAAEYLAGLGRVPVAHFAASRRSEALLLLTEAGTVALNDYRDGRGLSATFAHPLFSEAVWDRVGDRRRREILREHLAAERATRSPDHVRIAVLSLEVDADAPADTLMPAVRLAAGGFDAEVVLRFASVVAANVKGSELGEAVTAQVGALLQLGRIDEAAEIMRGTLTRVRPSETAVRLALLLHEMLLWGKGDQPAAAAVLHAQRKRYPPWIRSVRAAFALAEADGIVFAGRQAEALDLIDRVVGSRRRLRPELAVSRSYVRAHALAQLGRVAEAVDEISDPRTAPGESGDSGESSDSGKSGNERLAPELAGTALVLRSFLMTVWGQPDAGAAFAKEAHRIATDAGFKQGEAWAALNVAESLLHVGDLDSAAQWAERAATAAERAGLPDCLRLALMIDCVSNASRGLPVAEQITSRLGQTPPGIGFLHHQLPLAGAWVARAKGDTAEADRIMAEALTAARRDGAALSETSILHEWIRMGRTGVSAELSALPRGYPLMTARLALARGIDAADPALLIQAADLFEAHEMPLFAAEAAAQEAVRSTGQEAAELARRARTLASRAGSPRTPLLQGLTAVESLTARERQVAALARSQTSAQIAAELHLSVRTVENHLSRAFRKLGITSRAEIPSEL
ncbi:MAG: LuxR C-terminal-related transcriptional regulator [Leucobacter sp.]